MKILKLVSFLFILLNFNFWSSSQIPLHEWTSTVNESISTVNEKGEKEINVPENLTTWIFEDGTFVPMAKLQGDKSYSIITDHLGTPTEAYNEEGQKVWSRELGIYGQTRKETGVGNFVPFKYQGQYEDVETELCYNRFRYYDNSSGIYISQDPIRLAGNNPNFYAHSYDSNTWADPMGLINFNSLTDSQLVEKIGDMAYRNKRDFGGSGGHGVIHRIREQITGAMRAPSRGWFTHDGEIKTGLKNLRDGLNNARTRGIMDQVLSRFPNVNKVANLKPPKPSDLKVPKICKS